VLVGYFVYYTLQYNGIPSFLHVTTLLPVYSNPDLLHHKIISSTMLLLILTFSSTASLQSSGLSHTTGFNLFSTSGFIALLLVLHYLLTPVAPIATSLSSGYKNFNQRLLLNCTSSTILLLDLLGPLRLQRVRTT
jgi:hypothetical protein